MMHSVLTAALFRMDLALWMELLASEARPRLLRTKFYRPRPTRDLIRRPRVREILTQHVDRTLTLVCAPAGFGKTTLLSDWLDETPLPSAWLSLDQNDNDLSVFLTYFVNAVRSLFPRACADTLTILHRPGLPPFAPLVTTLVNDLEALADDETLPPGQRFILVLDDYHLVQSHAVHTLMGELLRHPPRTVHLILSTRQDPPFPLHSLRAGGQLGEIRVRELRFNQDEVAAFMEAALGAPLSADTVATLAERTEGWATGLRLAALAMSTGGDLGDPDLAVDNRFVLEYLLNEVLARIPAATEDFLLKTSILGRLCGSLCDAVAGAPGPEWDGSAFLRWLASQNLFTFALDEPGDWYRYHHLFQRLLRSRLERKYSGEEIAELHVRACAWLDQNGLVNEALEHALAAGDEDVLDQIVENHRHRALNQEDWRELEEWLALIPRRLLDRRPTLMMLEAWVLHGQFRLADLAQCLERAEEALRKLPAAQANAGCLQGEIDTLRGQILYWSANPLRAAEVALTALSLIPAECTYARSAALTYYAGSLQMQGLWREAVTVVHEALSDATLVDAAVQARLVWILCAIYWMAGDTSGVIQTANHLLKLAEDGNLPDSLTRAYFYLGCAHYVRNELPAAEKYFRFVVERRRVAYALIAVQSGFGLAAVYQAREMPEEARAALALAHGYAVEADNEALLRDVEAFGAHLALLQDRKGDAERWAAGAIARNRPSPMPLFYASSFAIVESLLSTRTPSSLEAGWQRLHDLYEVAESEHNTRFLIETLALQALVSQARRDRTAALAFLERALALAEPGNVIRVFLDAGREMGALLRDLRRTGAAPEFVGRLLAAFGEAVEPFRAPLRDGPDNGAGNRINTKLDPLVEPLSQRELEVLSLLKDRLSNKEIAKELSISPMTVKRHTVNIYQKLAVGGRRAAVTRAAELYLIPDISPTNRSR